jgi:hypothetical protein
MLENNQSTYRKKELIQFSELSKIFQGYGSASKRAKMTPKKLKKGNYFYVWKCWTQSKT